MIGRVRLGADVSIWFGASLRGDNEPIELGERTNIQEKATLHVDPGFPIHRPRLHRRAQRHPARLPARRRTSLIGMGATHAERGEVGANCLVGANALVTEGKEFPDGSLIVGARPALSGRLTGTRSPQVARAADVYVARWQDYARRLAVLED